MKDVSSQRVVVVTGCSSGIGRATVSRLARLGFHIVGGIRTESDSVRLREISDLVEPVMLDVTDGESVDAAVEATRQRFPEGIDGLVNNAGIAVAGPLEHVPSSEWLRQYEVNVLGMVRVTQAFLPMLRGRNGRIVNVGSAASNLALPMLGPYASSKMAVDGLTDSLRREVAPLGIKVTLVSPGQTDTEIFDKSERETELHVESARVDYNYEQVLRTIQNLMHQSEARRQSPDRVARAVERALTAAHPRRRYYVGWDARGSALLRFVPPRLVDWAIARTLAPAGTPTDTEKSSVES